MGAADVVLVGGADETDESGRVFSAEHGGRFVAALERGALLACQFHPELSGAYGRRLLARWLEG